MKFEETDPAMRLDKIYLKKMSNRKASVGGKKRFAELCSHILS